MNGDKSSNYHGEIRFCTNMKAHLEERIIVRDEANTLLKLPLS